MRAVDAGLDVSLDWFLTDGQIELMCQVIGAERPLSLGPLLEQLPEGTRGEHIQFYLKCQR